MDAGRAFSYVFEDRSWVSKVLIGGLLTLTGVLFPSMLGFAIDTARNVRDGVSPPMPEWGQDFGNRWVRGFSLFAILFIWGLVLAIPFLCIAAIAGVAASAGGSQEGGNAAAAVIGVVGNCLSLIVGIVISLAAPAILVHYVNRGRFAAGFEVGAIWRLMNRDWGTYLLVWLLFLVAEAISGLGVVACFIGLIFTYPYAYLIMAHLAGQLAQTEPGTDTTALTPEPL